MKHLSITIVLLSILVLVACTNEPEPDIEATVAAALAATQTAAPTNTPLPPTATPEPTLTPTSVPTDTPSPTATVTDTPQPTDTPVPVFTATPDSALVKTELESGDTLYELPQEGFSLTLPEEWRTVDLNKIDMAEIFEAVGEQNEDLEGLFSNRLMKNLVAAGIKFYALNLAQESVQATVPATINVLKQELPFEPTLEMYTELSVTQLEQFFDLTSEIDQEQVAFGDNPGVVITYTAEIVDQFGRSIEVLNKQYLVLEGPVAYIVTLSIPVELAEKHLESYSEVAETFRLIEN